MAVESKEDSTSSVPVKPERRKKKGPPPVPAPYAGPKKPSSEVSCEGEGMRARGRRIGGRGRERKIERGGDRGNVCWPSLQLIWSIKCMNIL